MTVPTSPAAGGTRETGQFRLADNDGPVTVRKLVSKGERLAIDSETDSIKLDALLLESLSWQRDREVLYDLLDVSRVEDPLPPAGGELELTVDEQGEVDDELDESAARLSISNEYSRAVVSKVTTDAGEGLRILAPARGTDLTLGVRSVRALTSLDDTFAFSEWFKTPFGPEDAPLEGPL